MPQTNWRDVAVKVGWTLLQAATSAALVWAAGLPPEWNAVVLPALTALSAIVRQRAYVPPTAENVAAARASTIPGPWTGT